VVYDKHSVQIFIVFNIFSKLKFVLIHFLYYLSRLCYRVIVNDA